MPTKQKSGLYRTKVKIGVGPDGKDIVKWVSGKTKKELEDAKREVIERYIGGTGLREDRLFGEYASEWFHVRKEPFVKASTRNNYRTMLNKHLFPMYGERMLRAITAADLQQFVNGFAGQSKSQITSAISTVQGIFDAAVEDRIIDKSPAEHLKRPIAAPPEEKRALTEDERERVLKCIAAHKYGAYLAVMYYTGMRPGEVRGLQWGDFDWDNGLVHVQRDIDYAARGASVGELKTKNADRYIPIVDELRIVLYPMREMPDAFVFPGQNGKPLAQVTAIRMWIELMCACGMAEEIEGETCYGAGDIRGKYRPIITPHTMRHNYITMCWEQGIDALITMKLVGHADYQTTMNVYTHLSAKHMATAKEKINSMFEAQKKSCTKVAQGETGRVIGIKEKP